jgi:predicted peptidase
MMKRLIVFLVLVTGFLYLSAQENQNKNAEMKFTKTIQQDIEVNYLLYLPENCSEEQGYPMILFLHGSGERGNDINLVEKHGPPKVASKMNLPFIVVSPQCPAEYLGWDTDELKLLLDEIIETYPVDTNRIYITGLSMGGFGTWDMAIKYPEYFAAAIPVCGGGNSLRVCRMKDVPVWAFHGQLDDIVPLSKSEEMIEKLQSCGGDARLTVYPEANHDSWTTTYENPEIYNWLLNHRKE